MRESGGKVDDASCQTMQNIWLVLPSSIARPSKVFKTTWFSSHCITSANSIVTEA